MKALKTKIKCVLAVTEVVFRVIFEVSTTAAFNPSIPVRKGEKRHKNQYCYILINCFFRL